MLTRDTESDVLIFLDCCHAGSSIAPYQVRTAGVVEVLGACGFEATTPLYGEHCFTHNLVAQLEDDCEKQQKIEEFYTNLYARLNNYNPKEGSQKRASAVRYCLVGVTFDHSIRLGRLPRRALSSIWSGGRRKPKRPRKQPALALSAESDLVIESRGPRQTAGHPPSDMSLQVILRSLSYESQSMRYNAIPPAYRHTFQWIFENGHSSGFAEWLSDGNGLYWISGKPGSGKSTLMKIIVDHPRTKELLFNWGENRRVITAVHCFWNSGVIIQKSLQGFFRSIIVQILQQWPEIANLFRERFMEQITTGNWDESNLRFALEFLTTRTVDQTRICLFIDGLDECDGFPYFVSDVLLKLARGRSIKICTSSRPWTAIQLRFRDCPSLRLQDLTYLDIKQYVEMKLLENPEFDRLVHKHPDAARDLIANIIHLSEGVFVWVVLVVRSLIQGLEYADSIRDLNERVNELPTNLADMYSKMLQNVTLNNRQHASRIFQLLRATQSRVFAAMAESYEPILTDIGLVIAEQVYKGNLSANKQDCVPWTQKQILSMQNKCRTRIQHLSQGLLTLDARRLDTGSHKQQYGRLIAYSHQTARMFIEETAEGRALLDEKHFDFDPARLLLESVIIQLKRLDLRTGSNSEEDIYHLPCWSLVDQGMRMARKVDRSNIRQMAKLLQILDQTMQVQIAMWSDRAFEGHWSRVLPLGVPKAPDLDADFLSFASGYGVNDYGKVEVNANKVKTKTGRPYLDYALFPDFDFIANPEMVQLLLSHGANPAARYEGESLLDRFREAGSKFSRLGGQDGEVRASNQSAVIEILGSCPENE